MPALNDSEMYRLSDLLSKGRLNNAREIAALLKIELGEPTKLAPEIESLQSYFDMLDQIANQR